MHVRWRAGAGIELVLSVQAVLDPVRISAERRRGEYERMFFLPSVELTWGVGGLRLVVALALRSLNPALLQYCYV